MIASLLLAITWPARRSFSSAWRRSSISRDRASLLADRAP